MTFYPHRLNMKVILVGEIEGTVVIPYPQFNLEGVEVQFSSKGDTRIGSVVGG